MNIPTHLAGIVRFLPGKSGWIGVMYTGFFDESGDLNSEAGVFCVSGYLIESSKAIEMDKRWGDILKEHGISHFHMVDCAHGNGEFSGMDSATRVEIEKKFIALIKELSYWGYSYIAQPDSQITDDVYTHFAKRCINGLNEFLKFVRLDSQISFFFEAGHASQNQASAALAEQIQNTLGSVTFADKASVHLLQAADLLAWQTRKYVQDMNAGNRAPRKDFMSLMEHDHHFYYEMHDGDSLSLGTEIWPVEKRPENTTVNRIVTDGELVYLVDELTGIVSVHAKAVEQAGVTGDMPFITLRGLDDRSFRLMLTDHLVIELTTALHVIIDKMRGSTGILPVPIESVKAQDFNNKKYLSVTIADHAGFDFLLEEEMLEELIVQLTKLKEGSKNP